VRTLIQIKGGLPEKAMISVRRTMPLIGRLPLHNAVKVRRFVISLTANAARLQDWRAREPGDTW
jgi:hypothetical protein